MSLQLTPLCLDPGVLLKPGDYDYGSGPSCPASLPRSAPWNHCTIPPLPNLGQESIWSSLLCLPGSGWRNQPWPSAPLAYRPSWTSKAGEPDTTRWSGLWYPSRKGAITAGHGLNRGWMGVPGGNTQEMLGMVLGMRAGCEGCTCGCACPPLRWFPKYSPIQMHTFSGWS